MASSNISVCMLGHIDSGKSTLVGHLAVKTGAADARVVDKNESEASLTGKASYKYAWITDTLPEERNGGITILPTISLINSKDRKVTIIDAPGHNRFVKNAILGVAQADAAVLVVSAAPGELEANLSPSGQAREHTLLAYTLGVKRLIVAVNKMDLVGFSEDRFEESTKLITKLVKSCGFNPKAVAFVPLSAWTGDALDTSSNKMPWYKGWNAEDKQGSYSGSHLMDAIDSIVTPKRNVDAPLRLPIQHVYNVKGLGMVPTGRIASGKLAVGDTIVFGPTRKTAKVESIEVHRNTVQTAEAGDIVGLKIDDSSGNLKLEAGMVCGDPNSDAPKPCESFIAQIVILNHTGKITPGYTPTIACHTASAQCKFTQLIAKLDRKGNETEKNPTSLRAGDSALVKVVPLAPICVDAYSDHPSTGRFAVRDLHTVCAVGMVKSVVKMEKPAKVPKLAAAIAGLDF